MPDIWMDVDTALASVPVNKLSLIDDTDFKTIEDAVAYNQAGLALFWNFTTTAGVTTVTSVTPTTGGVYDWTDFTTSGMYGIEMPASGGASANNDTEGFGHFTGVATGILSWTGPEIGFRAAALNNALIDGGDNLDINVVQWLGTTVATPTTAGVPSTALTAIGLDAIVSTATGMVEIAKAVWDRLLTGLTHNIKNSAGKILRQIAGTIWTDGTAQSGGNNFIQLASGDIATDGQYQRAKVILVDGTGAPAEAIITGSTAADDIVTTTPAWVINPDATTDYQVIPGQAHATVNDGGFDGGRIFVNFAVGTAGTVPGVNGTIKFPSSVLSDARIIADREKSQWFDIKGGVPFLLDQDYNNWIFDVINATRITLNGWDISGSAFFRTGITGVGIGTSRFVFELCGLFDASVDTCNLLQTGIGGTVTLTSENSYFLWDCFQTTAITPIIDVAGDGITPTVVFLLNYSGDVELQNMTSVDKIYMSGQAHLTLNANCAGGTLTKAGDIALTDNSGNVAITTGNIDDTLATLNDPRAEPGQGALPVNPSMAEKTDYLYKLTRNLKTNDGSITNFYNDGGTVVDHKQSTSSVSGTVSKTEIITGP